ncbi:hypothetical protein JKP88DRAFT_353064 [Tribonema minus]|uniref:DNA damage-binding protein 1 n=1 Tax=Tribonema minus TaxID=303371 RepID=A0A835ZFG4_9STRA|nr:hypothetical protein JKP88DRAFT_353064 [Tribonema minus]
MSYNYVVTAQRPTAVTHSLLAHFTSAQDANLITAKGNRLNILTVTEDGLQGIHDAPLYGSVACMEAFRLPGESQDLLFILTARYQFCILGYDTQSRLIALYLYEGVLKVIPIDARGNLKDAFNLRLDEFQVLDIQVNVREKELAAGPWRHHNVEAKASKLVAVPEPMGGLLVLGQTTVTYHNGISVKATPISQTMITAVGRVDDTGGRYLVGDITGGLRLIVLSPDKDNKGVETVHVEALGETSCASCITYIDEGVAYVGSTGGDSQLIRLMETPGEDGSYVEVLESFSNLGPIVDLCLVDFDKQGQAQAVTCSGCYRDGSLRVIRNGIGINEQASIELEGIKGMWSLREGHAAPFDKYLVQSFITETRVLAIEDDEMGEVEMKGFLGGRTIFCGNVIGDLILQVAATGAVLLDSRTLDVASTWNPPAPLSIIVATANSRHVVLACGGGNLFHLEVDPAARSLAQRAAVQLEHEIACLSLNPRANTAPAEAAAEQALGDDMAVDEGGGAAARQPGNPAQLDHMLAVGLWTDLTVRLLSLTADLSELARVSLGGDTQARSVLLPIGLNCFVSNGSACVFVTGDRPTVMYSRAGKVLYSSVNITEVNSVCTFHSEQFPECLALANEGTLTIGTIDGIQKLHIRTIKLGEQPQKIVHHEGARLFGLLTCREEEDGDEVGYMRFLDDTTFDEVHHLALDPCEMGCSATVVNFSGVEKALIIVGTAYVRADEYEPSAGRLLAFGVEGDGAERTVTLLAEAKTDGAVYALEPFQGALLAGVNSAVQLYKWRELGPGLVELALDTVYAGFILAMYMKTRGNLILVGDLLRSMSLLQHNADERKITEVARDYSANWMTAVEILDDETFLGAENDSNLFTVKRNTDATTEEVRARLDLQGEYHLGDFVNVFATGSLVMQPVDADRKRKEFGVAGETRLYGALSGAVGCIIPITKQDKVLRFMVDEMASESIPPPPGTAPLVPPAAPEEPASPTEDAGAAAAHWGVVSMTVEDVLTRVDDMARMH